MKQSNENEINHSGRLGELAPLRVRRHVQHNQTSHLSCRFRSEVLFLKGTFEILANTRAGAPATRPDAHHRCGSIFEAMFPIQSRAASPGFLLSVDTKRSPTT